MLTGTDALFGTWLVFFRDQLSTILSAVVLLPLTLFLNWRLALVLIVLVARVPVRSPPSWCARPRPRSAASRARIPRSPAPRRTRCPTSWWCSPSPACRPSCACSATSPGEVIRNQFPVLNWWALVNVMTRAVQHLSR